MANTKMTLIYCGMQGDGGTVKECKQDAARKIEAALAKDYVPRVEKLEGIIGVAYESPTHSEYFLVWPEWDGKRQPGGGTSGRDDIKETIQGMKRHMAQNCTDEAKVVEFLGKDTRGISDWRSMQQWQAIYWRLKAEGVPEAELHQRTCEESWKAVAA